MCVGFVAHFAQIGLIRRVDVHVLLAVTAVCKSSVAAVKLTLKRLFTYIMHKTNKQIKTRDSLQISHFLRKNKKTQKPKHVIYFFQLTFFNFEILKK